MCGSACRSFVKNEFHWRNFGFSNINPTHLYMSRWPCLPRLVFPVYRTILGLYAAAVFLTLTITDILARGTQTLHHWTTYLSNWHYATLGLYFVYAMIIALYCNIRDFVQSRSVAHESTKNLSGEDKTNQKSVEEMNMEIPERSTNVVPWYLQIQWLWFDVVAFSAFPITALYYGFIYVSPDATTSTMFIFSDINLHALNSTFIVLEIIFSNVKLRIYHSLYGAVFCTIYIIFTAIFWAFDKEGNIIYSMLDWNDPLWPSVIGLSGILGGVLIWVVLCLFEWGLRFLQTKLCGNETLEIDDGDGRTDDGTVNPARDSAEV